MAITIEAQPDQIHPAYNPVVYFLDSTNKNEDGFRYIVEIFEAGTSNLVAEFRVAPRPGDGLGYVDISKIIQSRVTNALDLTSSGSIDADTNSIFRYDIKFGEEFYVEWTFDDFFFNDQFPIVGNATSIGDTTGTQIYPFLPGDQIVTQLNTPTGDFRDQLTGLFNVVDNDSLGPGPSPGNPRELVLNLGWIGSGVGVPGTIRYADNRKSQFKNLLSSINRIAFNRAYSFQSFVNYSQNDIILGSPTKEILTNAPRQDFKVWPWQNLWWNFFSNASTSANDIVFDTSGGESYIINTGTTTNRIHQVDVSPSAGVTPLGISTLPMIKPTTEWYEVYSRNPIGNQTSERIRIYIDRRCPINETQLLFMDRAGSWSSFGFTLRTLESGTLDKENYRKEFGDVNLATNKWEYSASDSGLTTFHSRWEKRWTLNTDWMSDSMSLYFEELLTSPEVYVQFDGSNDWYRCIIEDSSFETVRQKNRKLIRKTVTIRLAIDSPVNV